MANVTAPESGLTRSNTATRILRIPDVTYNASFLFSLRKETGLIISIIPAKNDQNAKKQIKVMAEINGLKSIRPPAIIPVSPIKNSHGFFLIGLFTLIENMMEKIPSTIMNVPKKMTNVAKASAGKTSVVMPNNNAKTPRTR